jgi:uncharacterized membrane protein
VETLLVLSTSAVIFGIAGWNLLRGSDGTWPLLVGLHAMALPMFVGAVLAGWLGYLIGALATGLFFRSMARNVLRRR